MRYIIDAQLPQSLAETLREFGHDAIHVQTLPRAGDTSDAEIAEFADANDRIVVTKDNDFRHSHERGGRPRRLPFVKLGNIRNRELRSHFSAHDAQVVAAFESADFVELGEFGLVLHLRRD